MIFNPTDGTSILDEIAHPQWTQTTAFGLTSAPQLGQNFVVFIACESWMFEVC